jgi:hypothetical protein
MTLSSKTGENKKTNKLFLNDMVERVCVPDKTSLKINAADGQPGQLLGVFQISSFSLHHKNYWLTCVGMLQKRHLSRRPGRNKAGSIKSGLLVAPSMYTPERPNGMHLHVH